MNDIELMKAALGYEKSVWQAVVEKDSEQLKRLLADDYIEITLDGTRVTKSEIVKESPVHDEIESYHLDSEIMTRIGPDAILLSYHLAISGTCRGKMIRPRDRWVTSIWTHRGARWQCASFQQSRYQSSEANAADDRVQLDFESFSVVPMQREHVTEVMRLWAITDGVMMTFSDNDRDLSRYFDDNPQMSQVAMSANEIVGAILCGHDGRRGYVHHLAVAVEHRGNGIGRALVDACTERLREVGIEQCNLFLVDDNELGRQFWNKLGWGEWPNIRLMSKRLD